MGNAGERPVVEDEAHGHHHHGTGVRWVDLVIAGSAILISVVSLVVSIGHGQTMERLVEANAVQVRASTLPILRYGQGNLDVATGRPAVHFQVANGGTGPAIIEAFRLSYHGHPITRGADLLRSCCGGGPGRTAYSTTNTVAGQTLPAGQSSTLLEITHDHTDPAVYAALERTGRFEVRAQACYCSVLGECSVTDFSRAPPRPIAHCPTADPNLDW